MCSWRPSESLLICPCLLSPWPPDSHYSAVCACVLVRVGQWLHCRGSPTKMCSVVNPSDSNTHPNAHVLSYFCPQQPWLPRPWKRRDWRDKSMKRLPFPPLQKTHILHTCKKIQGHITILLSYDPPNNPLHTNTHTPYYVVFRYEYVKETGTLYLMPHWAQLGCCFLST